MNLMARNRTEFEKRFIPDVHEELDCLYEYLYDNGLDNQDFYKQYFPTMWAMENPEYFEAEMRERLADLDTSHMNAFKEFIGHCKRRHLLKNV